MFNIKIVPGSTPSADITTGSTPSAGITIKHK
jgi:hypothetical protein